MGYKDAKRCPKCGRFFRTECRKCDVWWNFFFYVEYDKTWCEFHNVWDDGWVFEWNMDAEHKDFQALGQFIKLWAQSTLTAEDQEKYRDVLWSGPGIHDYI
jgi:hypothetical protein